MGTPIVPSLNLPHGGDSPEPEPFEEIPEPSLIGRLKGRDYKNLGVLLRQCRHQRASPDHGYFWPYALLEEILTEERVAEELRDYARIYPGVYDHHTIPAYAKRIVSAQDPGKRYIKVFAILVLIRKGECINEFMEEEINDHEIPLVKCKSEPEWDFMLSRRASPHAFVKCLSEWDVEFREQFVERQHEVNVAFLGFNPDLSLKHEKFDNRVVLPWVARRDKEPGGFGDVYEAICPARSHGFRDALNAVEFRNAFVVKKIRQTEKKKMQQQTIDFWKEVEMLKRFSGRFHDHLVTLLMTWDIGNEHYLLFPRARCDLEDYWEKYMDRLPIEPSTQEITMDALRWLSSQILGLTKALGLIHEPLHLNLSPDEAKYGRHGDIKAENILYYPSQKYSLGILVIADFGLGALNSDKSRSNIPGYSIPMTPHYRPPECDLEGGTISRSFDIWTYGCLLLELVCWALGGYAKKEDFDAKRTTPYITGSGSNIFFDVQRKGEGEQYVVKVKEEVSKYIVQLHADRACTQFFHDLLDLIEDHMVIVEESKKSGRIRSTELIQAVEDMDRKVNDTLNPEFGPNYCQRWRPEPRTLKPSVAFEAELNHIAKANVQKNRGVRLPLPVHKGEVRKSKTRSELEAIDRAP